MDLNYGRVEGGVAKSRFAKTLYIFRTDRDPAKPRFFSENGFIEFESGS
jgi:hypothetical protein